MQRVNLRLMMSLKMIGEAFCMNRKLKQDVIISFRVSSRQDKALFSFLFVEKLTRDLMDRMDSLEEAVRRDHRKMENMLSNISDIYDKIENNKKILNEKCSKNKLNRVYKTVEKLESSIELIEDTNIIALEHLVKMIKGSARKETNSKMLDFEKL